MSSRHKFYCQHKDSQFNVTELVKVHLKSDKALVFKYEDTDCGTTFKLVLNTVRVEKLIDIIESAYQGDSDYESPVIKFDNGNELYVENQDCAAEMHHSISFENDDNYESVHLSSSDLLLMKVILEALHKKMSY